MKGGGGAWNRERRGSGEPFRGVSLAPFDRREALLEPVTVSVSNDVNPPSYAVCCLEFAGVASGRDPQQSLLCPFGVNGPLLLLLFEAIGRPGLII